VYAAGTIRVDGHGLSGIPVFIVFFTFLGALAFYSIAMYRLWQSAMLTAGDIRLIAYLLTAIFSLMLPMLSNDIFSLLMYGDAANRGVDVYTDIQSYSVSPYFDYVSPLWRTAPCVYGPVSLGSARLASLLAQGHIVLAIAVYKAIVMLWAILFVEMTYRVSILLRTSVRPLLFILFNPIFLIQGVAQLHCDLLAVALCAGVLFFFFSGRWYLAFIFAGIMVAAKMNFVLVLGFLIGALFFSGEKWTAILYKSAIGLCFTLFTLFILYYPYYTSAATLTVPLKFLFGQNPGKSLAEVLGDIIYFAPSVISGHHDELNATMGKSSGVSDPQLVVWLGVKKACQLFAVILSLIVVVRFWMAGQRSRQWMSVFLRFILIFLMFYSHVFYAWYLMLLLPFVWFDRDERFMQWLFILMAFSNVHDIMCAVNHGTPVYFLVLPLTLIGVLLFFWRFRNNFFTSLSVK
jgi:hypothetical protein